MQIPAPEKYQFSLQGLPLKMEWIESLLGYPEGNLPEPFPGVIGSIIGAIVVLAIVKWIRGRIMAAGKNESE